MLVRGGIDPCGSCDRRPVAWLCAHLATLCRFDDNIMGRSYLGPFIPCERRTGNMEIWEIQGRDFRQGF